MGPKHHMKPKVHIYTDGVSSHNSEPTSSHITHMSYHAQGGSVSVACKFIKMGSQESTNHEGAIPSEVTWLPANSEGTLELAAALHEPNLQTTSSTSESLKQ